MVVEQKVGMAVAQEEVGQSVWQKQVDHPSCVLGLGLDGSL